MRSRRGARVREINGRAFRELLSESAAGIAASGDSGSGKSNALVVWFEALVRQGIGATLIDPHGDFAAEAEHRCAALPRRLRDRVVVVRPSDLSKIIAINPLAVPDYGGDWVRWRAQIASKVSQVARTLLYAWGEKDFNSKPVLFKWMTRALTTLATARLTMADARHFFRVEGDVYRAMAAAAPDALAQLEMSELGDMRPRDREELIASAKNRFLGFLENPAVELALGRPDNWIDPRTLLREGYITIVSLERGGVLREEDVEIFANLWLTEILYAAYNLRQSERVPHVIFLDELPVFCSSYEVLTRALAQVRKYLIRFVTAFQGTQFFPRRTEDPLLNALMSQCRTTVVFRHRNPVDAKYFSELTTLPSLDPMKEKFRLTQLQQLQSGHDLVYLTDESNTWSDASQSGGSATNAVSSSRSESRSETHGGGDTESRTATEGALHEAVTRARSDHRGDARGHTESDGKTRSDGASWSTTATRGGGRTRKATLVPRLITRDVVTSIQLLSMDEQVVVGARDIARQDIGEALIYTSGLAAMRVRFPLARRPFERTPDYERRQLVSLRDAIAAMPAFATPHQIMEERRVFERRLVEYLEQLIDRQNNLPLLPPSAIENSQLSI